jgi:CubicO group peptidase (beta-lactamase class C family)
MNDGKYKNTQIISPVTNDLIQRDQLAKITGESNSPLGQGLISGVVRDSDFLNGARGSEGTIFWGGYFNTAYFADPNEKIIGIIYKQTQMIGEPTTELFNQIIFGAITK